ncbi:MAG TPA: ATP-binding protein [Myxococcales bacterium]|nr:ATP-binding protein [Myxococcales bacterium]
MSEHRTGPTSMESASAAQLVESAPDAMVIVDREGRIVLVNRQTEQLFGYGREELLGREVEMLVSARARLGHPPLRELFFRSPSARVMGAGLDIFVARKDGREFPVEIALSLLQMDARPVAVAAIRDATERHRLNGELEAQTRRAEQASRMKSDFLASMSHELRTPLNGIIGFSQLMADGKVGPLTDRQREYLNDVLTSAHHLMQLINDVLDLAKIESGKMEFRPEPVDLRRLADEVRSVLLALAANKRISVSIDVSENLATVILDPARLKQVLYNYLSNAIKFTPEGGEVRLRFLPEAGDHFRIEVEDTGIGIEQGDLARLFGHFEQLDTGPARKYQGTGLGLALTRRVVEAQGGMVGARSTPGKGSVFFAVLPRLGRPAR